MDQADKLRKLAEQKVSKKKNETDHSDRAKVISITSGKGGVGKSNISLNLSIELSKKSKKVCLIDGDFALANLCLLMGINPQKSLSNYFGGDCSFDEIIYKTKYENLFIISASSSDAFEILANLTLSQIETIKSEIAALENLYDFIIIDTAAGIHSSVMRFVNSSDAVVLIITAEATSISDAYALYKVALQNSPSSDYYLITNMVQNIKEGKLAYERFSAITEKFLKTKPTFIGSIEYDKNVTEAVKQQRPVMDHAPSSTFSLMIKKCASFFAKNKTTTNKTPFLARFLR